MMPDQARSQAQAAFCPLRKLLKYILDDIGNAILEVGTYSI